MIRIDNSPQIQKTKPVNDKYKNIPKKYMDVAQGMETQFTNHLLSEMQKTVHTSKPDSGPTRMYKSFLNRERAEMMAKSGTGIGVKDLVLNQIYPQHMRQNTLHAVEMYKNSNINSQRGGNDE